MIHRCHHCGQRYEVADHLAGKRGRCKHCGVDMVLTAEEPDVDYLEEAPPPTLPPTDPLTALQAFAVNRPSPPPTDPFFDEPDHSRAQPLPVVNDTCPSCGRRFPPRAGHCIYCGYNPRTGQRFAFSRPTRRVRRGPTLRGIFTNPLLYLAPLPLLAFPILVIFVPQPLLIAKGYFWSGAIIALIGLLYLILSAQDPDDHFGLGSLRLFRITLRLFTVIGAIIDHPGILVVPLVLMMYGTLLAGMGWLMYNRLGLSPI